MYDAIVVGARCAGSPTALLLARKGYRVLLVDKATFPSDMTMSTHWVHQPGIAALKRWGLLEKVRASNCPPLLTYRFDFGGFALTGAPPPADGVAESYSPRRTVLDKILVDAAVEAGAELREGFVVDALAADDGHVSGIRGRDKSGAKDDPRARLVIGADGLHSLVARAVKAPEYNAKPELMGGYFSYWSGVRLDGVHLCPGDYRFAFGWMTNDDLALVGVNWAIKDFHEVRHDIEGNFLRELSRLTPLLAEQVRAGKREAKWLGGTVRNFFRKPYGPGWALVGDAGYKKDPCTAAGITDAFRDAESLVQAIDQGLSGRRSLEEALADHQRRRDEIAMPIYEFTCEQAKYEPPSLEMQRLFHALRGNQEDTNRFFGLIAQTTSIPEFFAPQNIQRIIASA
jgi:flavin-dependent dehydrogenase